MRSALIVCAGAALVLATLAQAQPAFESSISVGLEGEGEARPIEGWTDRSGNVTFNVRASGRYTAFVSHPSRLQGPVRIAFGTVGGSPLISEPIRPRKQGGRAYALDKNGRRLTMAVAPSSRRWGVGLVRILVIR